MIVGYYKSRREVIDPMTVFEMTSEDNMILVYYKDGNYKGFNKIKIE